MSSARRIKHGHEASRALTREAPAYTQQIMSYSISACAQGSVFAAIPGREAKAGSSPLHEQEAALALTRSPGPAARPRPTKPSSLFVAITSASAASLDKVARGKEGAGKEGVNKASNARVLCRCSAWMLRVQIVKMLDAHD